MNKKEEVKTRVREDKRLFKPSDKKPWRLSLAEAILRMDSSPVS